MADWPAVLGPAVLVALLTRIDARVVGPYFALSSLIAGTEGVTAHYWYDESQRRTAVIRRFAYPCLAGFALAWTEMGPTDITAVGLISAGLLIWPVIFSGLPWYVPRRTWHLIALYSTFILGCGLASLAGLALQELVLHFADGDVADWFAEQLASTVLVWLGTCIVVLLFRSIFRRTRDEAERRESAGAEEF